MSDNLSDIPDETERVFIFKKVLFFIKIIKPQKSLIKPVFDLSQNIMATKFQNILINLCKIELDFF